MGGPVCVSGGTTSIEGVGDRGDSGGDADDVDICGEAVVGEVREGVVREDINVGGGGEGVPMGDEGQGVATAGGGEGGPGGDVDGDHRGENEDGSDDRDGSGDHGGDDDEEMLALVVRDPTLPLLRPDDFAQVMLDADDLAQVGTQDPFPHTGRRSGERRRLGGAYSPPAYLVQSPRWSGSSLSGIRGRGPGWLRAGRAAATGADLPDRCPHNPHGPRMLATRRRRPVCTLVVPRRLSEVVSLADGQLIDRSRSS
ncbi:hypothetical protein CBR_g31041 [Chara braunii]|uniref:Uncharacterized protein n=1 Tax=Chara braunii TaxID=69332 RepID=A0A388LE52_CHABU|nr:hypothetical protein CBR_g31041 [Chara braunii]|eukprot:GBG80581.1 hypothetical protein CBR_g31041 [Chara braunii]